MTNLYEPDVAAALKARIAALGPGHQRQWGTMTAAQAMAHCAIGMEVSVGDRAEPRMFIGRLVGRFIKPLALGERPFKRNTPTAPFLVVKADRDLEAEKLRLVGLVDRFVSAGPTGCPNVAHAFFGPMNAHEWARLQYKHIDHHLRQFAA